MNKKPYVHFIKNKTLWIKKIVSVTYTYYRRKLEQLLLSQHNQPPLRDGQIIKGRAAAVTFVALENLETKA